MPWILAIDFGTTSTSVAMRVGDRVELVEIDGAARMPSMVFWREGSGGQTGRLMIGTEAENLASRAPWALERTPKRRLGDELMLLGDKQVRVTDAVAAILRTAAAEAIRRRGGESPSEVRLTYPARWGAERLSKLERAAQIAGLGSPRFIPEPVAAATHFASERLAPGQHVAVYDLGGGTFDTAVLKRTEDGGFEVVGVPGGREDLGGEDFDNHLYRHLGAQLDPEQWSALRTSEEDIWRRTNLQLLREAQKAKETLSKSPDYDVYVAAPVDAYIQVTAEELQGLITADIESTVTELERTIVAAGLDPSKLAAIYLAGGSSRIPLVSRLIERRFGQPPDYLDDPKSVIALGAARALEPDGEPQADAPDGEPQAGAASADPGRTVLRQVVPVAGPHDRTALDQTVVSEHVPKQAGREASEESEPPPVDEQAQAEPRRDRPPRKALIGVAAAVVVAVIAVVAVVALSGGGTKKKPHPAPRSAQIVSEASATRLLERFETIWDEGNPSGLDTIMAHSVTMTYPGTAGSQSVTGLESVVGTLKSQFFANSAISHDLTFENHVVSSTAQATTLTASYAAVDELEIPGPGSVTVSFLASDAASPASSPCRRSPCISQMIFRTQGEASG